MIVKCGREQGREGLTNIPYVTSKPHSPPHLPLQKSGIGRKWEVRFTGIFFLPGGMDSVTGHNRSHICFGYFAFSESEGSLREEVMCWRPAKQDGRPCVATSGRAVCCCSVLHASINRPANRRPILFACPLSLLAGSAGSVKDCTGPLTCDKCPEFIDTSAIARPAQACRAKPPPHR